MCLHQSHFLESESIHFIQLHPSIHPSSLFPHNKECHNAALKLFLLCYSAYWAIKGGCSSCPLNPHCFSPSLYPRRYFTNTDPTESVRVLLRLREVQDHQFTSYPYKLQNNRNNVDLPQKIYCSLMWFAGRCVFLYSVFACHFISILLKHRVSMFLRSYWSNFE